MQGFLGRPGEGLQNGSAILQNNYFEVNFLLADSTELRELG